jgi:hypothetical protein
MAQFPPSRTILEDERAKDLFFKFLTEHDGGAAFDFDEMLRLWFCSQASCLVGFLEFLDRHGLVIKKK